MGKIIAVANQKGGVGKTTTSVNLAAALAALQRRVLLVDLDPQGNATMGSGVNKKTLTRSSYDVLLDGDDIHAATLNTPDYALLPGNAELTAAEVELLSLPQREFRLRTALARIRDVYHYVIIDCPPALNMLTINALVAAHSVLIPMQCEYYALEGLSALLDTVDKIRAAHNSGLRIDGLLRTMFDPRNNLANDVSAQLIQHFGARVYDTAIPRNVRLAEAPSHGMSALRYDRHSRGAEAYFALALEIVRRQGDTRAAAIPAAVAPQAAAAERESMK